MIAFSVCLLCVIVNVNSQQKWDGSMDRLQMPRLDSPLGQSLLPSVMGGKANVKDLADKALSQGLRAADPSFEVNSLCLNHTEMFLESLITGQQWALKSKFIRITCPCVLYPLTPHFYTVKLGFTGVYIISYVCSKT